MARLSGPRGQVGGVRLVRSLEPQHRGHGVLGVRLATARRARRIQVVPLGGESPTERVSRLLLGEGGRHRRGPLGPIDRAEQPAQLGRTRLGHRTRGHGALEENRTDDLLAGVRNERRHEHPEAAVDRACDRLAPAGVGRVLRRGAHGLFCSRRPPPVEAAQGALGYGRRPVGKDNRCLWTSELLVSDAVGRLMEFWGFKRNMGRIWSVLYLSPEPLSAEDLRHALRLSSGAVSMTLSELSRWGVVRRVSIQGERKDFYAAEVHLWRMISRVLSERERVEIASAVETFEDALRALATVRQEAAAAKDKARLVRVELQRERIAQLLELARLGKRLLDGLVATARLDAEPLVRFLLGPHRPSPC